MVPLLGLSLVKTPHGLHHRTHALLASGFELAQPVIGVGNHLHPRRRSLLLMKSWRKYLKLMARMIDKEMSRPPTQDFLGQVRRLVYLVGGHLQMYQVESQSY